MPAPPAGTMPAPPAGTMPAPRHPGARPQGGHRLLVLVSEANQHLGNANLLMKSVNNIYEICHTCEVFMICSVPFCSICFPSLLTSPMEWPASGTSTNSLWGTAWGCR